MFAFNFDIVSLFFQRKEGRLEQPSSRCQSKKLVPVPVWLGLGVWMPAPLDDSRAALMSCERPNATVSSGDSEPEGGARRELVLQTGVRKANGKSEPRANERDARCARYPLAARSRTLPSRSLSLKVIELGREEARNRHPRQTD